MQNPAPYSCGAAAPQAVGSPIFGPTPQPHQGHAPPNSHPSDLHNLHWTKPLRPTKLGIHWHAWSPLSRGTPLSPAKSVIHRHFTISTWLHLPGLPSRWSTDIHKSPPGSDPHTCTGLHDLRLVASLRPAKLEIHRDSRSPPGSASHVCTGRHDLQWAVPTGTAWSPPQRFTISTGQCLTRLHRPAWSSVGWRSTGTARSLPGPWPKAS
jgi:hypothetical protein